jgi:hypothetical protein
MRKPHQQVTFDRGEFMAAVLQQGLGKMPDLFAHGRALGKDWDQSNSL